MIRFDRILGILLELRGGRPAAAGDLARRFEVSRRTIYRDMDTLSALGVPVFAERGSTGGFRLLPGYFLPPLMLTRGEAVSLVLGLAFWRSLPGRPLLAELETAERKLLATLPDTLRGQLAESQQLVGFEHEPPDLLHPEPQPQAGEPPADSISRNGGAFLQALLDGRQVRMLYRSPYRAQRRQLVAVPLGIFRDRGRWYLVGQKASDAGQAQPAGARVVVWRADRVLDIQPHGEAGRARPPFDVRALLGRQWLHAAMRQWTRESPVTIRLTAPQAALLQQDWYYRLARFEPLAGGGALMTYGADQCAEVFALLRWLGPGAELIEPRAWRQTFAAELKQMRAAYSET